MSRRARVVRTGQMKTFLSTGRGRRWLASQVRRIGETAEQRLHWLLDFLRLDLALLTPGELEAKGDDLRAIAMHELRGVLLKTTSAPMPPGQLRSYQEQIDRGLRDLLGKECRWRLPGWSVLERDAQGVRIVQEGADERTGILSGVAQLVLAVGGHLRACADPTCGRPFVATKRQAYCSTKHSQRIRNRKRLDKQQEWRQAQRNGKE